MKAIFFLQNVLIALGVVLLAALPFSASLYALDRPTQSLLYGISFSAVFLVMLVRPLADIFIEFPWIRRLIVLRKGFGILSASIIVGFMIQHIVTPGSTYVDAILSGKAFSFENYSVFAYAGDISGLILLMTSNRLSQRILKTNWKRVQRLSYVYFYSGGVYEAFFLESSFALYAVMVVTSITVFAWAIKILRKS